MPISVKPSPLASQPSRCLVLPYRLAPYLPFSDTSAPLTLVLTSVLVPPIRVVVLLMVSELLSGSFVMMLIVPAMAFAPKRAEPPPRTTSTRSIILAGICSKPYTPANALNMGRLSIRICV